MATHKLIPYAIRLRKKHEKDDWWDLSSLHTRNTAFSSNNFADFFYSFCDSHHANGPFTDEDNNKTFGFSQLWREGNTIEGVINTGNYGFAADLYDVEEEQYDDDGRLPTHSEELPFYFMFHLPSSGTTRAYLLLKQFRNFGTKGVLRKTLRNDIGRISPDILLRMPAVVDSQFIEEITNVDRVARLKFIQKGVPKSLHRNISSDLEEEDDMSETIEIRADKERSLYDWETMKRWIQNEDFPFAELYDQDYDDIKVTIEQSGSERTFSIFQDEVKMQEVLSPNPANLNEGHPNPEWISPYAEEFMNNILEKQGYEPLESTPLQS